MAAVETQRSTSPPQYGYLDSLKHWWGRNKLEESEKAVLSTLPFYPDSDGKRVAHILNVPIDGGNKIHEFNIKNVQDQSKEEKHVVLVHGYGAALGLFINNFEDLTERPGTNLHALDMLGYGLSSRPKFPSFRGNSLEDVEKVENFFLDSLESWRKARDIEKFYLVGHSFGGYLSALYTLRYPEHVEKVVLVSPVGLERSKFDLSSSHPPAASTTAVEGPDVEQELGGHHHRTDSTSQKKSSSLHVPDENGYVERVPNLPNIMRMMWERNISPFTFLRALGPYGPYMTKNWSFRRFSHLEDKDMLMKLHVYCYNTFVAKGSGEYALTRILGPGALARYPLLNRVPEKIKTDSLWLYGDVDWMSKEAGKTMVNQINRHAGGAKAEYGVLSGAGHHLYLDNPVDFKKVVFKFLDL